MKIDKREDIQAGDVVTYARVIDGVLVTETEEVTETHPSGIWLESGVAMSWREKNSVYAILDIERPVPPLPTEPGTVIDAKVEGVDGVRRLLRTNASTLVPWVSATMPQGGFRWFGDAYIESWTLVASA